MLEIDTLFVTKKLKSTSTGSHCVQLNITGSFESMKFKKFVAV